MIKQRSEWRGGAVGGASSLGSCRTGGTGAVRKQSAAPAPLSLIPPDCAGSTQLTSAQRVLKSVCFLHDCLKVPFAAEMGRGSRRCERASVTVWPLGCRHTGLIRICVSQYGTILLRDCSQRDAEGGAFPRPTPLTILMILFHYLSG